MRTSHMGMGMGISDSDWEVFMRHSAATLNHLSVPARKKEEVLAFFTSLKSVVVEKP